MQEAQADDARSDSATSLADLLRHADELQRSQGARSGAIPLQRFAHHDETGKGFNVLQRRCFTVGFDIDMYCFCRCLE